MYACQLGDVRGRMMAPPKRYVHFLNPRMRECDLIRKMVFEDVIS